MKNKNLHYYLLFLAVITLVSCTQNEDPCVERICADGFNNCIEKPCDY